MTPYEYQKLAQRTECDHAISKEELIGSNLSNMKLLHAAIGLTSDAGEVAAAMERHIFYRRPLDLVNLKEELGDCLWYIALACNALGESMEDVMKANIAKLQRRYPEKFDSDLADEINRDRAEERRAIEAVASCPVECKTCGTDERVDCSVTPVVLDAQRVAKNQICPHCSNPISDEVVKRLILKQRQSGGCPQCSGLFVWNESQGGLDHA